MQRYFKFVTLALLTISLSPRNSAQLDLISARFATVLSVEGKAYYSTEGVQKGALRRGLILPQGAKVTTESGAVELYFRQIGSIVKVMPQSEVVLQKLAKREESGLIVKDTLFTLNKGRMLARARVLLPESRFQVDTPVSSFVVAEPGYGRYEFRADGSAIVGAKSKVPLKVTTKSKSIIARPSTKINPDLTTAPLDEKTRQEISPVLDEMEAVAEALTQPPAENEVRPGGPRK